MSLRGSWQGAWVCQVCGRWEVEYCSAEERPGLRIVTSCLTCREDREFVLERIDRYVLPPRRGSAPAVEQRRLV